MSITILMPALTPTMSDGSLVRWCKEEGDAVKAGDVLAEIETDKATIEFEAVDEGVLDQILVPAGSEGVEVNRPIAVLLQDGEGVKEKEPIEAVAPSAQPQLGAGADAPLDFEKDRSPDKVGRVFASPLARRVARELGVDLAGVVGSGPRGRIRRSDVEDAKAHRSSAPVESTQEPAVAPTLSMPVGSEPTYTEVPLSSMRKVIARRLSESKQTVPHFYLTIDCQIDRLLALRTELNGKSEEFKLSVNDFVIRAAGLALRKVPAANASYAETAIRLYSDVDISVAVATPNGLITPVIRCVDRKGLAAISEEMKSLAGKAREAKLKPEEYQGGSFTISNLGMHGIRDFAAIINPPQSCILAVGAGEPRPVVIDGALAVATMMTCTLSVDHRVVDGALGAELLAVFKSLIEQPLKMLL